MIAIDDMNDYIGVMGGHPQAKTPNIDVLANSGVLFSNAHTASPLCKPSRASFLTGLAPTTTNFFGWGNDKWQDNEVIKNSKTISEYFMDNGYVTYRTGKISHSGKDDEARWNHIQEKSHDYGPFANDGSKNVVHPNTILAYAEESGALDGTLAKLSDVPNVEEGYNGWKTSYGDHFYYESESNRGLMPDERSANWIQTKISELEDSTSTDPFFMAVGIIRPHTPFVVPDKYFEMFPIDDLELPLIRRDDQEDTYFDYNSTGYKLYGILDESYTDRQLALRKKTQAYLACVAFVDDVVGQLIGAIDDSRFKDNTMIMLFSDHGYHIGEKEYLRKNTLWEESTRVPLIIRHPGYGDSSGGTVSHPVSLLDIYPTLKDICSLEGSTKKNVNGASLDGNSLKPFLIDPNEYSWAGPATSLTQTYNWGATTIKEQNYSLRSRRYRYTRYNNGNEELYDHKYDPNEWNNLDHEPGYNEVITEMSLALSKRIGVHHPVLQDELKDKSKMLSDPSSNFRFKEIPDLDLIAYDPEQLQRNNLDDAHIIYDIKNANWVKIDFWTAKNDDMFQKSGILKAFLSSNYGLDYTEIPLSSTKDNSITGSKRRYFFENNASFSNKTHLKIVLTGGDSFWVGLIGKVRFYQDSLVSSGTNVDAIEVEVNSELFELYESDLRTNESGMPGFSDSFEDNSKTESITGSYYIATGLPANFDGDENRIVRSNFDSDLEIVYTADQLKYFRIEYWSKSTDNSEESQAQFGTISAYLSENSNQSTNYEEELLKFVKIKKIGNWTQYAIVPFSEISKEVAYFKVKISGGVSTSAYGAQYGAIHLYNKTLNKEEPSLSVTEIRKKEIVVFPNPVKKRLYINGLKNRQSVTVFNALGQIVLLEDVDSSIDVSNLKSGIYSIEISNIQTIKFVKN